MKLQQWLDNLNEQIRQRPELLELEIIASIDDEGNGYNYVNYTASTGLFEDNEFEPLDEDNRMENVVCLN